MRSLIVQIFGTYTPLIDPETGAYVQGLAGLDLTYCLGAALFLLFMWFILRLILNLVNGGK